jgi:hypothetical protein
VVEFNIFFPFSFLKHHRDNFLLFKFYWFDLNLMVLLLEDMGETEAKVGKGTRSDLRHDNHTVSLLNSGTDKKG